MKKSCKKIIAVLCSSVLSFTLAFSAVVSMTLIYVNAEDSCFFEITQDFEINLNYMESGCNRGRFAFLTNKTSAEDGNPFKELSKVTEANGKFYTVEVTLNSISGENYIPNPKEITMDVVAENEILPGGQTAYSNVQNGLNTFRGFDSTIKLSTNRLSDDFLLAPDDYYAFLIQFGFTDEFDIKKLSDDKRFTVNVSVKGYVSDESTLKPVYSGTGTSGDYVYDVLDDGTVKIFKYAGSEKTLDILSEIDGKTVTSIGKNAFEGCVDLEAITIPDCITNIGDKAFIGCDNLDNVIIPESVMNLGRGAFAGCINLKNIELPNSLTVIKSATFNNCQRLESIVIPNSVTTIESNAFCYCFNLKNVTLPDSLTTIESVAFDTCLALKSIDIPDSVTSIGKNSLGFTSHYDGYKKIYGFTINGYSGSAAEEYANKNGFAFVSCGESTNKPQFTGDPYSGDINGDDFVDISDVVLARSHIVGNINLTEAAIKAADKNKDGVLDIMDVVEIRSFIVNQD